MRTGRCQCGEIRYESAGEAFALYICHCRECQKQSASAFGISLDVPRAGFCVKQGKPKYWIRSTDSGRKLRCAFCPNCGSRLWHESDPASETISIKGGSLASFQALLFQIVRRSFRRIKYMNRKLIQKIKIPKLNLSNEEKKSLRDAKIKIVDIATFDLKNFKKATAMEEERCKDILASANLQKLDGVGPSIANDLITLKIYDYSTLAKADPRKMYRDISLFSGAKHDPCVYDVFACAVKQAQAFIRKKTLIPEHKNWWFYSKRRPKDLFDFEIKN